MGHDHHFLSRLDRVDRADTEFALGLYRDHELVRLLLAGLDVPESVSRVAIALHDRPDAPNIIVARNGHFVTCLGPGMNVGNHPRVSRARVDATVARVTTLRERMRDLENAPEGRGEALIEKVHRVGGGLTREDFAQLAAWQPVFESDFLIAYLKLYDPVLTLAMRYARQVRGVRAPSDQELHDYSNSIWAMGHLWILATMGAHDGFRTVLKGNPRALDDIMLPLAIAGWLPLAMRAWWGGARLGPTLLSTVAYKFAHAQDFASMASSANTLVAIGLRHPELAAEIRAVLADPSPDANNPATNLRQQFAALGVTVLDDHADVTEFITDIGHDAYRQQREWVEKNDPAGEPIAPTCSDDLARAILATSVSADPLMDGDGMGAAVGTLPWLAQAGPEELYVPRAWQRRLGTWNRDEVLLMLGRTRKFYNSRPVHVEATPGRNEPCSCGSGKKFKRCCGAGG